MNKFIIKDHILISQVPYFVFEFFIRTMIQISTAIRIIKFSIKY